MSKAYQRVIVLPEDISNSDAAQLEERLRAAVDAQRELAAKSPHVLQFLGNIKKGEGTLYVEHEPADMAFDPSDLFNLGSEGAPAGQLMQLTAALFDAMSASHDTQSTLGRTHGAISPGVILLTPDGIHKVTDFGFAPAFCATFGSDSYLNLAVGPPADSGGDSIISGVWEVLSPDEFDREDRICAFVDPEKYGTGILEGFEPGSDVIAAGFVLHLIAEHQHPYLVDDPDAHRMVDMSSMMDAMRYNNARRKDLRESSDEGTRLWCDLVTKMLARLPRGRPTAGEVSASISKFVKPVDAGEILRRRLDSLIQRVHQTPSEQVDWQSEFAAAQLIQASQAATDEVKSLAKSFLAEAEGHVLLARALELSEGDHWAEAKEPLEQMLALPDLPDALAAPANEAFAVLKARLAIRTDLETIEARSLPSGEMTPEATKSLAQELLAQLEKVPSDQELPESLLARRSSLHAQIQAQYEEACSEVEALEEQRRIQAEKLEKERKADFEKASDWLEKIQSHSDGQEWAGLRKLLEGRPVLKHWPDHAESRIATAKEKLDEFEAEQKRQAAIEADAVTARQWVEQLQQAVESQEWEQAEAVLKSKPSLTHWPTEVVELDSNLAAKVREARKRLADASAAQEWFDQLEKTIGSQQWQEAGDVLAREPSLEFWPPQIPARVAEYRKQIEERMEAAEIERRRIEQARKQVQNWLAEAQKTSESNDWKRALEILKTPPLVEPFPDDLRSEADRLKNTCNEQLEEARANLMKRRVEELRSYAVTFTQSIVKDQLARFIDPKLLEISLNNIEFDSHDKPDLAAAVLSVSVRNLDSSNHDSPLELPCTFQFDGDLPRLCEEESELGKRISSHVGDILAARQKAQAADLFKQMRSGFFPEVKIHAKLDDLEERLKVRAALCGPKVERGNVETELVWSPDTLVWNHADPKAFVQSAMDIVIHAAKSAAEAQVLEQSKALSRYRSRLAISLQAKDPSSTGVFPTSVELETRVSFQPSNDGAPVTLQAIPSKSLKLGELSMDATLASAETNLAALVLEAQNSSLSSMEQHLSERIKGEGAKVKLATTPKRLKAPQDQFQLELKTRQGQTLAVSPRWEHESLEFIFPKSWHEDLIAFLEAAPRDTHRRGLVVPIAVAAIAVVVVGGVWAGIRASKENGRETTVAQTTDSDGDGITDAKDQCADTPRGTQVDALGCPVSQAPPDSDNDGVVDAEDRCPDTRAGVPVDAQGCPVAERSIDTDQDGIPDKADECPNTPAGSKVDDKGCVLVQSPSDSDGDGVPDEQDQCPKTPNGVQVNEAGCQVQIKGALDASAAAAQARQIIVETGGFSVADAALLVTETSTPQQARLILDIPGLKSSAPVALTEKDPDGAWKLSDDQINDLRLRLSQLGKLKEINEPLALSVALPDAISPQFADFVDTSRLLLRIGTTPDWKFINGEWLSSTQNVEVLLDENDPKGVPVEGNPIVLQPVKGHMTVPDSDGQAAKAIAEAVRKRLLEALSSSLEKRTEELRFALKANRTNADDPAIELAEPLTDLRKQVAWNVIWQDMQARKYSAVWDASELSFNFGDRSSEQADLDTLAHEILWSINDLVPKDHWIRRATSGRVTELKQETETEWILSVPAPWQIDNQSPNPEQADRLPISLDLRNTQWLDPNEDPNALARRILENGLQKPAYWPLVETYVEAQDNDPAFQRLLKESSDEQLQPLIGETAERDLMRAQVIPFWRSAHSVLPVVRFSEGPIQVVASETGPEKLLMMVRGHWDLATGPGTPAELLGSRASDEIAQSVQQLFEPRPGELALSIDSGNVVHSWSDGQEMVTGFAETWQNVEAIEEQLDSYPVRKQLEEALEQRIGPATSATTVAASVRIDGAAAWNLLQQVWKAKGAEEPVGNDLPSLTRGLQGPLSERGVMAQSKKRAKITPTVFAEYFTGPRFTYAVVWSADAEGNVTPEGPALLRLCRTDRISRDTPPAALGPVLLDPVFNTAANACAAKTTPDTDFRNQLGIVVAPDYTMAPLDLPSISFNPIETNLEPIDRRGGERSEIYSWATLADLDTKLSDRLCGFYLSGSLSSPSAWKPPEGAALNATLWAMTTLQHSIAAED